MSIYQEYQSNARDGGLRYEGWFEILPGKRKRPRVCTGSPLSPHERLLRLKAPKKLLGSFVDDPFGFALASYNGIRGKHDNGHIDADHLLDSR